ncbi:hypothetical protein FB99_30780 [Pantoea agglomerans]|nr:hypothetical protein FB99_30780 [Pantoea agglomerans]
MFSIFFKKIKSLFRQNAIFTCTQGCISWHFPKVFLYQTMNIFNFTHNQPYPFSPVISL